MVDITDMKRQSQNWKDPLCPKMQNRLQVALDEGRMWRISAASENLYEVHCEPSMSVNTRLKTCSCGKWQQNGFLFSYTVAVLHRSSQQTGHDIFDYIEPYFFTGYYQQSVADPIHPVVTFNEIVNGKSCSGILPPITKKMPGRPKKRRIPSRGLEFAFSYM